MRTIRATADIASADYLPSLYETLSRYAGVRDQPVIIHIVAKRIEPNILPRCPDYCNVTRPFAALCLLLELFKVAEGLDLGPATAVDGPQGDYGELAA